LKHPVSGEANHVGRIILYVCQRTDESSYGALITTVDMPYVENQRVAAYSTLKMTGYQPGRAAVELLSRFAVFYRDLLLKEFKSGENAAISVRHVPCSGHRGTLGV
jgi:hypothetical protein